MSIPPLPFFPLIPSRPLCRIVCKREWECDLLLADCDLWIVSKGIGRLQIDHRHFDVKAPQVFLFLTGQRVIGHHDPRHPFEVWCFHFSSPKGSLPQVRKLADAWQGMALTRLPLLLSLLEGFLDQGACEDALSSQQAQHFAWLIFSILWRQAHSLPPLPSDTRVEALIQNILSHPEKNWGIENMRAAAALASTQLIARFHALTGTSPAQFVINARIRHACQLLKETTLPVEHIAEACGYRDVYFFSRQFKQKQKMAPSAFRRSGFDPRFCQKKGAG